MRRVAAGVLCAATVCGLSACESNQTRSARIAKQGNHQLAKVAAVKAGAANTDVHVISTTLVSGDGGAQAVAVGLHDSGAAQAAVPVSVQARGASGPPLYTNATAGIQPSLQQVALVTPGSTVWWVDDQVSGAPNQKALHVRVSAGRKANRIPAVTASDVRLVTDSSGTYLTGTLTNHSGVAQPNLPIFAVGLRGGRVVAAGRALVTSLPAGATPKTDAFAMYFVGNPKGTQIAVTVAPTAGT